MLYVNSMWASEVHFWVCVYVRIFILQLCEFQRRRSSAEYKATSDKGYCQQAVVYVHGYVRTYLFLCFLSTCVRTTHFPIIVCTSPSVCICLYLLVSSYIRTLTYAYLIQHSHIVCDWSRPTVYLYPEVCTSDVSTYPGLPSAFHPSHQCQS